jgi:mRNA-degrading endonuclease toxin of MazEF toxin-antitoxin module
LSSDAIAVHFSISTPVPGDIVYCRFPEIAAHPPSKPHPALVTGLAQFEDGTLGVVVAYGTSQRVNELYAGEFAMAPGDGEAYRAAGLSFVTRFASGVCNA